MAVVPITTAKGPTAEPQNDIDMAIAAALLHREGHFDVAMDTSQMRRSKNVVDYRPTNPEDYKPGKWPQDKVKPMGLSDNNDNKYTSELNAQASRVMK